MRNEGSTIGVRGVSKALPVPFVATLLPHNKGTCDGVRTPISSETLLARCLPRHDRVAKIEEPIPRLTD